MAKKLLMHDMRVARNTPLYCAQGKIGGGPARLVHSLRLRAKVLLVDVVLGRRCRRDCRLHDLDGVGDLRAARELGDLPTGYRYEADVSPKPNMERKGIHIGRG